MAPGPATSGIASGNTAMSSSERAAAARSSGEARSTRRALTMSAAVRNSSTPPAAFMAGRPMPRAASSPCPASPNTASTAKAIRQARRA